jgi:hypothetical protein
MTEPLSLDLEVLRRLAPSLTTDQLARAALLIESSDAQQRELQMLQEASPMARDAYFATLRAAAGRPTVALRDGTTGYYVRTNRRDECFAACLATCLQVPISDVPDPRIDERLAAGEDPEEIGRSAWHQILEWLASRGLGIAIHKRPPAGHPRWIGVVPLRGHFNDHCLVMSGDEILFDPVDQLQHHGAVAHFQSRHVRFGYSFEAVPPRVTNQPQRRAD